MPKYRLVLEAGDGTELHEWILDTEFGAHPGTADFGLPFTPMGHGILADEIQRAVVRDARERTMPRRVW